MTLDSSRPVALVTGATRGIGRAIALDLGRTHHVIVGGRDQAALDALAAELPSASTWTADVQTGPYDGFLGPLDAVGGGLDVLVHSAGVISGAAIGQTTIDEWRRVFEINVFGVAEVTRLALPALRRAEGTVVLINSGAGFSSRATGSVYAGSKFALRAFADALREEERENGVRVSSVHPGRVDTDMQVENVALAGGTYQGELYLAADDVAAAVRLVVDLPHGAVAETISIRPLYGS